MENWNTNSVSFLPPLTKWILLTPTPPDNNNRDRDSVQTSLGCMQKKFFLFHSVAAVSFPSPCGVRVCMKFHYQREKKKKMGERESSPV